jgi:hypothetical protein
MKFAIISFWQGQKENLQLSTDYLCPVQKVYVDLHSRNACHVGSTYSPRYNIFFKLVYFHPLDLVYFFSIFIIKRCGDMAEYSVHPILSNF